MNASRWSSGLAATAALALAACSSDNPTAARPTNTKPETFQVTKANYTAANAATNSKSKLFYQNAIAKQKYLGNSGSIAANIINSPWDLTWNGGPVVKTATSWDISLNCATTPAGCWGTGALSPKTFIQDFNQSSLLSVSSQFVGENADGHFGNVNELAANVAFAPDSTTGTPTATGADILAILHAASLFTHKSGYDQIYHLFFPKGTDVCTRPGNCYSPDNFNTFVFCAFHGSVDFGPHWHVLFTVEPYQFVPGCVFPNVQTRVIDGTASTLSHEFSELITDPDLDAWFNDLTGNETGDLCFTFRNPEPMRGNTYVVQEEYSNIVHACTDGTF